MQRCPVRAQPKGLGSAPLISAPGETIDVRSVELSHSLQYTCDRQALTHSLFVDTIVLSLRRVPTVIRAQAVRTGVFHMLALIRSIVFYGY